MSSGVNPSEGISVTVNMIVSVSMSSGGSLISRNWLAGLHCSSFFKLKGRGCCFSTKWRP